MTREREDQALARITAALARIEAAAARPVPVSPSPGETALRAKVSDALIDLDRLIETIEAHSPKSSAQ